MPVDNFSGFFVAERKNLVVLWVIYKNTWRSSSVCKAPLPLYTLAESSEISQSAYR